MDTRPSSTDIKPSDLDTNSESTGKYPDLNIFTEKLEIMLQKFQESEDYCDLLFAEEFTSVHRGLIIK